MLCWWKERVLASFLGWTRQQYPKLKEAAKKWARCVEWVYGKYQWRADGDVQGKGSYKAWWKRRMLWAATDLVPGGDAVVRAARCSWWAWEDGSRPFHWRWPWWYVSTRVHFKGEAPRYRKPQRNARDGLIRARMRAKLETIRAKWYITVAFVLSLTSFFSVPKGDEDIRMVYNGAESGLNESIWVPRFILPTLETHLRAVDESTFMVDVDIGECFLNFILHRELKELAGVDLTHFFSEDGTPLWEAWDRAAMGLKSSPYQAVSALTVADEMIRGDRKDKKNVFRWERVRLNLPVSEGYASGIPWVSKVRKDGTMAADLFTFVDDFRPTGTGKKECWQAAHRAASILNFLGIQDAPSKSRDSSQAPGAWSGAVIRVTEDGVFVLADKDKWVKATSMIDEVKGMIEENPANLDRYRLEQVRGFLIYVT
jgi:hypothetical protein